MAQALDERFEALVRRAVDRFVQSAVVVDDRAFMGISTEPTALVTPPAEAEALALVEGIEEGAGTVRNAETDDPANTRLDAKAIVDAFASRGVVCAVLRPEPGEVDELTRVAPKAIRRSDLLILDWHLQGDDGDAAVALLKEVLDESGEALRLVAIYTGEPKRDLVARRLAQDLGAEPIGMLVAELRAIVEDDIGTRNCTNAEAVALWLEREAAAGRGSDIPATALASAIETDLFDRTGAPLNALKLKHPELGDLKPRQNEGLTELFASDVDTARAADERFAMRMTLRQVYDHPERYLSLGTIVKAEGGDYWLCVQPVCDSLRITGRRRYPFIPLAVVDARFQYVVEDDGQIVRLKLSRSLSEIKHWMFEADAEGLCVLAKGKPPSFVSTSGKRFRWVAQLNEGHAQRVAHELGVEQSRVGLFESDWLRRMSK